jgi:hypothetical protein
MKKRWKFYTGNFFSVRGLELKFLSSKLLPLCKFRIFKIFKLIFLTGCSLNLICQNEREIFALQELSDMLANYSELGREEEVARVIGEMRGKNQGNHWMRSKYLLTTRM